MPMSFQDTSGTGGSTVETVGMGLKTTYPARAVAVTPSDVTEFAEPSGVFVGSGGSVSVVPWSSDTPTPVSFLVPDGGVVPVMVKQVRSSGTTASDIVRVY